MIEVQTQSLVIDAVVVAGGAAHKLSNRFLVGVPDLLIKLPGTPAMLMEVKLLKIGARTAKPDFYFVPDVTVPQWKFLQDYHEAGMYCGLISFVEVGGKGVKGLHMAVFNLDAKSRWAYRRCDHVRLNVHVSLADPVTRFNTIVELLKGTHLE